MHGGDARKDERKAAASCARETVSPYDLGTPLPRDYPYDPRGRRLADGALATVILLRVAAAALAFAGLAWCAIWWAATSLGAALTAILCITLSALVLGRGLEYAAGAAFGRASLRLEPNVRHDYVLRVFRKGRRSAGTTPRFLLALARLDILRGQPRLAGDALARVDTSNLNPNRLKLLYLLQAVTAIQLQEDAHNAVIRYAGITGEKNAGFPPDNVVLGWAQDAADGRAPEDVTMRDVCASALQPRRHKPLLAVSLSVMLAHCLLFAGVATGVDATDSWRLRGARDRGRRSSRPVAHAPGCTENARAQGRTSRGLMPCGHGCHLSCACCRYRDDLRDGWNRAHHRARRTERFSRRTPVRLRRARHGKRLRRSSFHHVLAHARFHRDAGVVASAGL